MASNQSPNANPYPHTFMQFPHQPYIAPGLSFSDNNNTKFIGVFTATHLSICLLVAGFALIVVGLLGVVTKATLDEKAFHAVGISLLCFGSLLITIAFSVFVFAIRWGRKRVHVMERSNTNCPHISLMSVGYSYPIFTNTSITPNNNNSDTLQTSYNIPTPTTALTEPFYPIQPSHNPNFAIVPQQSIVMRPTAPPSTASSGNK